MTLPPCIQAPTGAAARTALDRAALDHAALDHAALDRAALDHAARVPVLETARLRLRAPAAGDAGRWVALCTGPDGCWLDLGDDPAGADAAFCVYAAGWLLHGHGLWAVERREDGALLGFVLVGLEGADPEAELGWLLAPAARGRGYAHEAAAAARDWALALLGSCASVVDPDNAGSARLAARLAARLGAARDPAAGARLGVDVWRHGAVWP